MPDERNWDWLAKQLEDIAKTTNAASIVIERVQNKLDAHDARIKALEEKPSDIRSGLTGYGGCLGQIAFVVLGGIGTLSGMTGTIISLIVLFRH